MNSCEFLLLLFTHWLVWLPKCWPPPPNVMQTIVFMESLLGQKYSSNNGMHIIFTYNSSTPLGSHSFLCLPAENVYWVDEFLTIMTPELGGRAGIQWFTRLHLVSDNCSTRPAIRKNCVKRSWKGRSKLLMKVDEAVKEIYEDWFRIEKCDETLLECHHVAGARTEGMRKGKTLKPVCQQTH